VQAAARRDAGDRATGDRREPPTRDAPIHDALDRAAWAAARGTGTGRWPAGTQAALAGLAADDPDRRVRAAALAALVRRGTPAAAARAWPRAAGDPDPTVRRRAAELAASGRAGARDATVVALLHDTDPLVAEAAAWALGERPGSPAAIDALAEAATVHPDALVREAAVAALGALGDEAGLPAILAACHDKPAVRRRAVLALAPFSGSEVDGALARALEDRDWQVRQAAEDLTSPR
jgi:HEAT repeat protein